MLKVGDRKGKGRWGGIRVGVDIYEEFVMRKLEGVGERMDNGEIRVMGNEGVNGMFCEIIFLWNGRGYMGDVG